MWASHHIHRPKRLLDAMKKSLSYLYEPWCTLRMAAEVGNMARNCPMQFIWIHYYPRTNEGWISTGDLKQVKRLDPFGKWKKTHVSWLCTRRPLMQVLRSRKKFVHRSKRAAIQMGITPTHLDLIWDDFMVAQNTFRSYLKMTQELKKSLLWSKHPDGWKAK